MKVLENDNNMFIISNGDFIDIISYKTHIARYNKNKNILGLDSNNWNYSQSTLQHLKRFINFYTNFQYTSKKEFEKEIQNNSKIKLVNCFK